MNDDHDDPAQNEQPVSSGFRVDVSRVERPRGPPALTSFADSSPASFIAGIKAARERIVARSDEDRDSYLRKRGFSKSETAKLVETVLHEEGRPPGGPRQGASGRASRA